MNNYFKDCNVLMKYKCPYANKISEYVFIHLLEQIEKEHGKTETYATILIVISFCFPMSFLYITFYLLGSIQFLRFNNIKKYCPSILL